MLPPSLLFYYQPAMQSSAYALHLRSSASPACLLNTYPERIERMVRKRSCLRLLKSGMEDGVPVYDRYVHAILRS